MKYIIEKEVVDQYVGYMMSSDSRSAIVGMQNLLFEMEGQKHLSLHSTAKVEAAIAVIISENKDSRVRQWGYMLGSFLTGSSLVPLCKKNFEREVIKNQTWIVALMSNNLEPGEFMRFRKTAENYISNTVLNLCTYLFSDYQNENVNSAYVDRVMAKGEELSLLWLGWIATFYHQNYKRTGCLLLSDNQLSELTRYVDENVLKHVLAAYSRREVVNIQDIKFDIFDYSKMKSEPKKWYFDLIWNDKDFIKNNRDFILEIFSKNQLDSCDKRVREGLASGLSNYDFDEYFIDGIIEWLRLEKEVSVRHYLVTYMLKYEDRCEDFHELIEDEKINGDVFMRNLISTYANRREELYRGRNMSNIYVGGDLTMGDRYSNDGILIGAQGKESGNGMPLTNNGVLNIANKSENVQQQGNVNQAFDYDQAEKILNEIREYFDDPRFKRDFGASVTEIQAAVNVALSAAKERKHTNVIKEKISTIRSIAEGVAGSLIASGIVGLLSQIKFN